MQLGKIKKAIQKAIAGVKDRTYKNVEQTEKELRVSKASAIERWKMFLCTYPLSVCRGGTSHYIEESML